MIDFSKSALFILPSVNTPQRERGRNAAGSCRKEPYIMKVKHIIFNASVLVKFPQTDNFFKTACNSSMGPAAYIRSHCVPRTDIWYIIKLLEHKNVEVIILSKTASCAKQVLDAFGISYSRSISTLDEIEDETSCYGYVTTMSKECETAKARGFRAVRFVPGIRQNICKVLALAGYKRMSNL